jgi:hypothetical protein
MTYQKIEKRKSGRVVMGDLPMWRNSCIVMGDLPENEKRKSGRAVMDDLPK